MKIFTAFVSILMMTMTGFCGGQAQGTHLPETFPIEMFAAYENCTILHVNATWIVVAHSERINPQHSRSGINAFHYENHKWRNAFSKAFEDAYNARIELRRDMQYQDNPIIVFRVQYGAAYEELGVYAIESGSFHMLQELAASAFEWSYSSNDSRVSLTTVSAHINEPRLFYRWSGNQFKLGKSMKSK